jgi:hypothetical protein
MPQELTRLERTRAEVRAGSANGFDQGEGKAKATIMPPAGRPDFPPPAEITTYWRPATA